MTTTALTAQIGVDALELTVAGVAVPGAKCGAVTIRRHRDNPDQRPDPATLTVSIKADALPALPAIGDPIVVELGADAIDRWWPAGEVDVDVEDARRRFTGTIAGPTTLERGVLQLVATGTAAVLGRALIGDEPWPVESDGARAARILALATSAGDAFTVDGTLAAGWVPYPTAPAILAEDSGELIIPSPAGAFVGAQITTPALIAGVAYTATVELQLTTTGSKFTPSTRVEVVGTTGIGGGGGGASIGRWITATASWVEPAGGPRVIVVRHSGILTGSAKTIRVRRLTLYRTAGPGEQLVGDVDAGTTDVLARDVDRRYALELLEALAVDAQAELVERRDGLLEWHDAEHRRAAAPAVELAASQVLRSQRWTQDPGSIVNDLTVVYGEADVEGNRPEVRVVDQLSVDDPSIGRREAKIDTQLAELADAEQLARTIVGRHSRPVWRLSGLTVELTRTVDAATARRLLALEFGDLLEVTGQPATSPLTAGRLWYEGSTELITRDGWQLQLEVSDYGAAGPAITWAELDPALTWADVPASISWLTATSWRAPTVSLGRWIDAPAGLRWTDVAPGTSWAEWPEA